MGFVNPESCGGGGSCVSGSRILLTGLTKRTYISVCKRTSLFLVPISGVSTRWMFVLLGLLLVYSRAERHKLVIGA